MTGETHMDFTADAKGKDTPVPSNPGFNQVQLHRMSHTQVEVRELKDGALVSTVRNKLSSDGNEMTVTTISPGHPNQIAVWTRTGAAKNPKDPFAGDWVQDLGKSRLRSATTVTITPDGRFTSDYTYTAHFDGKPYDVKNSHNDTVQLQLVDPHTVDEVFKRDGQVSQKDRWVVSADGKTMTMTGTATTETGQHITEKLTFTKQ